MWDKALRKSIAFFLAVCLLASDTAGYAQSKVQQRADLPAGAKRQAGSIEPSVKENNQDAMPSALSSMPIQIPPDLGTIEESYFPERRTQYARRGMIIYIQDAHDSLEAQENIAKIIRYLVEDHGVKTVFEEGYEGSVPTEDYFGFIQDPAKKEKVSYFLMDKLRLGGAEYAHINRKKREGRSKKEEGRKGKNLPSSLFSLPSDFQLIGADNTSLHDQNIEAYRRAAQHQKETAQDLEALESALQKLMDKRFPKKFKEWMKLKERFEEHKLDAVEYLRRTLSLRGAERQSNPGAEIASLTSFARNDHETFDAKSLFEELNHLEQDITKQFLPNERDRQLFDYSRQLKVLKKLSSLQMTPEEYQISKEFLAGEPTLQMAQWISKQTGKPVVLSKKWERQIQDAVRFYETAVLRERAIEKQLSDFSYQPSAKIQKDSNSLLMKADSRKLTAILVFGGFHKAGIREILKRNGFSYYVITPCIREISPRHQRLYRFLMADHLYQFEKNILARASTPKRFYRVIPRALFPKLAENILSSHSIYEREQIPSGQFFENSRSEVRKISKPVSRLTGELVTSKPARSEVRGNREHEELDAIFKRMNLALTTPEIFRYLEANKKILTPEWFRTLFEKDSRLMAWTLSVLAQNPDLLDRLVKRFGLTEVQEVMKKHSEFHKALSLFPGSEENIWEAMRELQRHGLSEDQLRKMFLHKPDIFIFAMSLIGRLGERFYSRLDEFAQLPEKFFLENVPLMISLHEFAGTLFARGLLKILRLTPDQAELVSDSTAWGLNSAAILATGLPIKRSEELSSDTNDEKKILRINHQDGPETLSSLPKALRNNALSLPTAPYKFMGIPRISESEIKQMLSTTKIPQSRQVIVASVHSKDEAKRVIKMFSGWPRKKLPLLIVASRYSDLVEEDFRERGLKFGKRTEKDIRGDFNGLAEGKPFAAYDVIFLNTTGELQKIYSMADAAILTSSRNPMEPALYSVPFVYLDRFDRSQNEPISRLLLKHGGAIEATDLRRDLMRMLADPGPFKTGTKKAVAEFEKEISPAISLVTSYLIAAVHLLHSERSEVRLEETKVQTKVPFPGGTGSAKFNLALGETVPIYEKHDPILAKKLKRLGYTKNPKGDYIYDLTRSEVRGTKSSTLNLQGIDPKMPVSYFLKAFGIDSSKAVITPLQGDWGRVEVGQHPVLGLEGEALRKAVLESAAAIFMNRLAAPLDRVLKKGDTKALRNFYLLTYRGYPAALVWTFPGRKGQLAEGIYYPVLHKWQKDFFVSRVEETEGKLPIPETESNQFQKELLKFLSSYHRILVNALESVEGQIRDETVSIRRTKAGIALPGTYAAGHSSSHALLVGAILYENMGWISFENLESLTEIGAGSGWLGVRLTKNKGIKKLRMYDLTLMKTLNSLMWAGMLGLEEKTEVYLSRSIKDIPPSAAYLWNSPNVSFLTEIIADWKPPRLSVGSMLNYDDTRKINVKMHSRDFRKVLREVHDQAKPGAFFLLRVNEGDLDKKPLLKIFSETGWTEHSETQRRGLITSSGKIFLLLRTEDVHRSEVRMNEEKAKVPFPGGTGSAKFNLPLGETVRVVLNDVSELKLGRTGGGDTARNRSEVRSAAAEALWISGSPYQRFLMNRTEPETSDAPFLQRAGYALAVFPVSEKIKDFFNWQNLQVAAETLLSVFTAGLWAHNAILIEKKDIDSTRGGKIKASWILPIQLASVFMPLASLVTSAYLILERKTGQLILSNAFFLITGFVMRRFIQKYLIQTGGGTDAGITAKTETSVSSPVQVVEQPQVIPMEEQLRREVEAMPTPYDQIIEDASLHPGQRENAEEMRQWKRDTFHLLNPLMALAMQEQRTQEQIDEAVRKLAGADLTRLKELSVAQYEHPAETSLSDDAKALVSLIILDAQTIVKRPEFDAWFQKEGEGYGEVRTLLTDRQAASLHHDLGGGSWSIGLGEYAHWGKVLDWLHRNEGEPVSKFTDGIGQRFSMQEVKVTKNFGTNEVWDALRIIATTPYAQSGFFKYYQDLSSRGGGEGLKCIAHAVRTAWFEDEHCTRLRSREDREKLIEFLLRKQAGRGFEDAGSRAKEYARWAENRRAYAEAQAPEEAQEKQPSLDLNTLLQKIEEVITELNLIRAADYYQKTKHPLAKKFEGAKEHLRQASIILLDPAKRQEAIAHLQAAVFDVDAASQSANRSGVVYDIFRSIQPKQDKHFIDGLARDTGLKPDRAQMEKYFEVTERLQKEILLVKDSLSRSELRKPEPKMNFWEMEPEEMNAAWMESVRSSLEKISKDHSEFFKTFDNKNLDAQDTPEKKIKFLKTAEAWPKPLDDIESTWIFNHYLQLGSFEDVRRFFEASKNESFKNSDDVRSSYLFALNRLGLREIEEPGYQAPRPGLLTEVIQLQVKYSKERKKEIRELSGVNALLAELKKSKKKVTEDVIKAAQRPDEYFRGKKLSVFLPAGEIVKRAILAKEITKKINRAVYPDIALATATSHKNKYILLKRLFDLLKKESKSEDDQAHLKKLKKLYRTYFPKKALSQASVSALGQNELEISLTIYGNIYNLNPMNYYAGTNVVRNLVYQGGAANLDRAKDIARLVSQVLLRADPKAFWTRADHLELAILLEDKDEIKKWLPLVIESSGRNLAERKSLLSHLIWWRDLNTERGKPSELLDWVIGELHEAKPLELMSFVSPVQQFENSLFYLERFWNRTQVLPNNASFNGLVPDMISNMADHDLVRGILEYPHPDLGGKALKDISDPEEADRFINRLVEDLFDLVKVDPITGARVRVLENLQSPQHQEFEKTTRNLLKLWGTSVSGMAATNIMMMALTGKGDCRVTNFFKQRLEAGRRKYRFIVDLQRAYKALKNEDKDHYVDLMKGIEKQRMTEVALWQVDMFARVELMNGQKGDLVTKKVFSLPAGREMDAYVLAQKKKKVDAESHTLSLEIERDEHGQIQAVILKDIWYQDLYTFGNYRIEGAALEKFIKTGKVKKALTVWNPESQQLEKIDVILRPAPYSHKRHVEAHRYASDRLYLGSHFIGDMYHRPPAKFFFDAKYRETIRKFLSLLNSAVARSEMRSQTAFPFHQDVLIPRKINLALRGGGAQAFAYLGGLTALEKNRIQIASVAGTSAGAAIACFVAAGFTADEIQKIFFKQDFNDFKDKRWGFLPPFLNLFMGAGLYSGDAVEKWIEEKLTEKFDFNPTFKDLPIPLTVIATNVLNYFDKGERLLKFNAQNTPDLTISRAVRMSMGLPFFYRIHRWYGKYGKERHPKMRRVIDGGLKNNFPLDVFGDSKIPAVGFSSRMKEGTPESKLSFKERMFQAILAVFTRNDLIGLCVFLIEEAVKALPRQHIEDEDHQRIIPIEIPSWNKVTNFDLSLEQRHELAARGEGNVTALIEDAIKGVVGTPPLGTVWASPKGTIKVVSPPGSIMDTAASVQVERSEVRNDYPSGLNVIQVPQPVWKLDPQIVRKAELLAKPVEKEVAEANLRLLSEAGFKVVNLDTPGGQQEIVQFLKESAWLSQDAPAELAARGALKIQHEEDIIKQVLRELFMNKEHIQRRDPNHPFKLLAALDKKQPLPGDKCQMFFLGRKIIFEKHNGIELLVYDDGSGIKNVPEAVRLGVSSVQNTLGRGQGLDLLVNVIPWNFQGYVEIISSYRQQHYRFGASRLPESEQPKPKLWTRKGTLIRIVRFESPLLQSGNASISKPQRSEVRTDWTLEPVPGDTRLRIEELRRVPEASYPFGVLEGGTESNPEDGKPLEHKLMVFPQMNIRGLEAKALQSHLARELEAVYFQTSDQSRIEQSVYAFFRKWHDKTRKPLNDFYPELDILFKNFLSLKSKPEEILEVAGVLSVKVPECRFDFYLEEYRISKAKPVPPGEIKGRLKDLIEFVRSNGGYIHHDDYSRIREEVLRLHSSLSGVTNPNEAYVFTWIVQVFYQALQQTSRDALQTRISFVPMMNQIEITNEEIGDLLSRHPAKGLGIVILVNLGATQYSLSGFSIEDFNEAVKLFLEEIKSSKYSWSKILFPKEGPALKIQHHPFMTSQKELNSHELMVSRKDIMPASFQEGLSSQTTADLFVRHILHLGNTNTGVLLGLQAVGLHGAEKSAAQFLKQLAKAHHFQLKDICSIVFVAPDPKALRVRSEMREKSEMAIQLKQPVVFVIDAETIGKLSRSEFRELLTIKGINRTELKILFLESTKKLDQKSELRIQELKSFGNVFEEAQISQLPAKALCIRFVSNRSESRSVIEKIRSTIYPGAFGLALLYAISNAQLPGVTLDQEGFISDATHSWAARALDLLSANYAVVSQSA